MELSIKKKELYMPCSLIQIQSNSIKFEILLNFNPELANNYESN